MRFLLQIPIIFFLFGNAHTQHSGFCGSDAINRENFEKHPELLQYKYFLDSLTQQRIREHHGYENESKRSKFIYIIPIVFHVVHNYGQENISDEQIYDQMRILNEDFRKTNADFVNTIPEFRDIAADSEIEFRLATKDPYRNCTNGINRYQSLLTYEGSDESKLNPWPRDLYLNVWVVNSISRFGVAGYAYLPSGAEGLRGLVDGIIILHNYVGSIGTSPLRNSHTLTHEIGHFLNLNHTWGSGEVDVTCGDDGIFDTPVTRGTQGCNLTEYRCSQQNMTFVYRFNSVTPFSGTTAPSNIDNPAIVLSDFKSVGLSSQPTDSNRFVFSRWDTGGAVINSDSNYALMTGSINPNKYYEMTISSVFGYIYTISGIVFNVQRSSDGPRTFAVRSSIDNFATNLPASIVPANSNLSVQGNNVFFFRRDITSSQAGTRVGLGNPYSRTRDAITFRIYAWNSENESGDFSIDDFSFIGNFGIIENIQNFMDYSFCYTMFTEGQKAAMQTALISDVSSRSSLWSEATLQFTGADVSTNENTCPPIADFNTPASVNEFNVLRMTCINTPVSFRDFSWRGPIDTWEWQFSNATPEISNVQNPNNIVFNAPGWQSVSLKVSGTLGESEKTIERYIYVTDDAAPITRSFNEDFENFELLDNDWVIYNYDNNASTFRVTGAASYSGGSSLTLNNFDVRQKDVDAIVTPAYNIAASGATQLKFKFSLASSAIQMSDVDDKLVITYSTNCGRTWSTTPLFNRSGPSLITAGTFSTAFVPDRDVLWQEVVVPLPNLVTTSANVRFKFEFTKGEYSNNLYIDNINIDDLYTSVSDPGRTVANLNVYPVPSSGRFNIELSTTSSSEIRVDLHDVFGKIILTQIEAMPGGTNIIPVNLELASGIYTLSVTADGERMVRKISIVR